MYISTAITYQTHIEAGQGRGRSVDDEDDESLMIMMMMKMMMVVIMMIK